MHNPTLQSEIVWDVPVCAAALEEVLAAIDEAVERRGRPHAVVCANPHSLVVAHADGEFLRALQSADVVLPDGMGIVLASRMGKRLISRRLSGTEFFVGVASRWNARRNRSFFFLGSTPDVLDRISRRMGQEYPHVSVCGSYAPPMKPDFDEDEHRKMISVVNAAAPDVLWVGMTAPKQEKWIFRNLDKLNVPVVCAVGATFDYFSGSKKRAPVWLRNVGLEWLPRLLREPGRMWRRNFVSTPVFLANVLWNRVRKMT